MRILLIEDLEAEAELFKTILEEENGWSVTVEKCLLKGTQRLAAEPFNLVLLDLGLPDSTPEKTLEAIPELSHDNPVIVLTGYSDPFVKAKAIGAADFLMKDSIHNPAGLIKSIRNVMAAHIQKVVLKEPSAAKPLDPRETLKKMSRTTRLPISDVAIESATPAQAENLMMSFQLVASMEQINTTLAAQNVTAQEHGRQLEAGAILMKSIDATTRETNGKVKTLRSEMDESNKNVKILMGEREDRILSDEADKLRREGLMVLPRKAGQLMKLGGRYMGVVLKWLGAVAVAWPALVWFWEHRIFAH